MKCLIQWSTETPQNWQEFDGALWSQLPRKSSPGPQVVDGAPGFVCSLCCQGVVFQGFDFYFANESQGVLTVSAWNPSQREAVIVEFQELAPDPLLGGAINTRQKFTRYNAANWADFHLHPILESLPGIRLPDKLYADHRALASRRSWREWGAGGEVPIQRALGRFSRSRFTRTYYQSDTAGTGHVYGGIHPKSLKLTATGSATLSYLIPLASKVTFASFITDAGEPNSSDWPNGEYRCQLDCTTAGASCDYRIADDLGPASAEGGFIVNNGGAEREQFEQVEANFTGTGLKLATKTINPGAGATGDRWEIAVAAGNSSPMTDQTLEFEVGTADSFADGPWTAASTWSGGGSAQTSPGLIHQVEVIEY